MNSARYFLACAAVSVLAACSADPVAPTRDEADIAPPSPRSNETSTNCTGTLTTVTNPDGSVSVVCVVDGRQHGSGG